MKKMMLIPVLVLVLSSFAFAADYDADFEAPNTDPNQIFMRTDLRFLTDFTLSASADEVAPGVDPNNLKSGDTICSGASVTITPKVTSKWALASFDLAATYPKDCGLPGGPSCPIQTTAGISSKDIRWLSPSLYNEKKSFGQSSYYDFMQHAVDSYNSLGGSSAFPSAPASYAVLPSSGTILDFLPGKYQSGANVFCKGTLRVSDGTTPYEYSMNALPLSVSFDMLGSGTKTVTTSLNGVDCIGMAVKKPEDMGDPLLFRLYHYALNGPSIASTTATDSISLTLQEGATDCLMHHTGIRSLGVSGDHILIRVRERNDGPDPMKVTGADILDLGGGSDYSILPYSHSACTLLGLGSICPSESGMDETFAPGSNHDVHFFLKKKAGATDDSVSVILSGESEGLACGGSGDCLDIVPISGIVACDIEPSSLDMKPQELAEFTNTCFNLPGDEVSCVGDDWFWWLMSGGFYEKDSTHAIAYPTSPAGTTGSMVYRTGITTCESDIELFDDVPGRDEYSCVFDPDSAQMNTSQTNHFDFNCLYGTDPAVPDDADYLLQNGLEGSLGNSDTSGTDFTAGDDPSAGKIGGFGWFTSHPPYILGAYGDADVVVNEPSDGFCPDPVDPYDPDCPPVDCDVTPWHPLCNDDKCDLPPYVYNDPDCDIPIVDCDLTPWHPLCNDGKCDPPPLVLNDPDCPPIVDCDVTPNDPLCNDGKCDPPPLVLNDPDCDDDPNNGEDDDGSSIWCTIGDLSQSQIGSGTSMYLHIGCGASGTDPCPPGIVWKVEPPGAGSVVGNQNGAVVIATAPLGTTIRVRAFINGDEKTACSKYLDVDYPGCIDVS